MRLSELLEEQSIKSISLRTMISEENIEKIMNENYEGLTKAKALGFLSILEREYGLNLKDVRNNAVTYFEMHQNGKESIHIALPKVEEKKGRSKWLLFAIVALLGYASWYFFTQFDQKRLDNILPFGEDTEEKQVLEHNDSIWSINSASKEEQEVKKEEKEAEVPSFEVAKTNRVEPKQETKVSEQSATISDMTKSNVVKSTTIKEAKDKTQEIMVPEQTYTNNRVVEASSIPPQSTNVLEVQEDETNASITPEENASVAVAERVKKENAQTNETPAKEAVATHAVITPVKRLWFGLVNMRTGKRDHFSVRKAYTIDLTKGNWLVATSPAPFSLLVNGKPHRYNNGKAHYFKITKAGLTPLSKKAYIRQGGYRKW